MNTVLSKQPDTSQTELDQLHNTLRHRARQLGLLNDLAREMIGLLDSTALYDLVTHQLWQRFGYYSVETFRVDEAQGQVVLASCAGAYTHLIEPGDYRQTIGQGIIGAAAQSGEIILANQARQHPAFYYLAGAEVQAELAIPLKKGTQVIGVLNVDSEQVDVFEEADVTLLKTVADQLVIALEKSRLFEETQQRADALARLFAAAADLATTLNSSELLTKIIRHLTEAIQATSGYILALHTEQQQVVLLAEYWSTHVKEEERISDLGRTYHLADYAKVAHAITGKTIVSFHDHDPDLQPNERRQLLDYGIKSVLIVPFVVSGRVLGEAEIWESRYHRTFTPHEINLAQTIAQHAASVIDNVDLFEQIQTQALQLEEKVATRTIALVKTNEQLRQEITVRQRTEEALQASQSELKAQTEALSLINAISDTLYRTLNYQAVVDRAVNALVAYARFKVVGIYGLNKEAQCLELLGSRNGEAYLLQFGRQLALTNTLGGEAVARREIIISADVISDERTHPAIREVVARAGLQVAIVIPILYQTEVLGTVHLLDKELPLLTSLKLKTLMAIGRAIGLAMSNASYVNQIETQVKERQRIELALQESEARFRRLAENAPDIVFRFRFDPPGYEYVNPAVKQITGYSPDMFYEDYLIALKIIHPDDHKILYAFIQKQIEPIIQVRLVRADGSIRWLEQRHVVIYDEAGQIVAVEGIGRDITALKDARVASPDGNES